MHKLKYLRSIVIMTVTLFLVSGAIFARDLPEEQNPFLWKINTSPPSWLFGTIHLPDERVTALPAAVRHSFDQSKAFYAEVPMDSRMQLRTTLGMLRNDQKMLSDVVPRKTFIKLQQRLKKIDPELSAGAFIGMKTWVAMMSLVLLESQSKNPGIKPLDLKLYQLAQQAGKRVGGLESTQQQLAYLDEFSEPEQIEMLETTLHIMDKMEQKQTSISEIMVQWYLQGDIDSISELIEKFPMSEDPVLQQRAMKRLITDRNRSMANSIAEILRLHPGESHFFAVGVAHLDGSDSVQSHLQKRGLSTQRVAQIKIGRNTGASIVPGEHQSGQKLHPGE